MSTHTRLNEKGKPLYQKYLCFALHFVSLSKLALNPCALLFFFFFEHLGFPPSLFKLHSYLGKVKPPEGHEFFALPCTSSLHLILLKSNHKTARVMQIFT